MLNLLKNIVDVINTVVNFFINTLHSIINLISNIPRFVAYVVEVIGLFPTILVPFILVSISIYVVKMVIGRD